MPQTNTAILTTKVQIPPQPRHTVLRSDLTQSLEQAIPHYKLILVSTPVGYGKTTFLSQWANSGHVPIMWVSLEQDDDDPERFFRCLFMAWESVQPDIRDSDLGRLLAGTSPNTDAVLSALINIASSLSDHVVCILDDYHLLVRPSIHQAMQYLLEHLPSMFHFVIATREEPPIPLATYRAHAQVKEFRADDLRFSFTETIDFLNDQIELGLDTNQVSSLHTHTEGWIMGLQLAALSLQRYPTDEISISGKHRFVADYLRQDVLDRLDDQLCRFLLETSILDRFCEALCDAVTGNTDSHTMLRHIEDANLFLIPLDSSHEWFRYHQLFSEFLHQELKQRFPDKIAEFHRRAADWYWTQDLTEPAFTHAVKADDAERVVQILERDFQTLLISGKFRLIQRWINSVPEAWFSNYPLIAFARVGMFLFTGQIDICRQYIDTIEQTLIGSPSSETRWQLARVNALRCSVACFQNNLPDAEAYADQALQNLRSDDLLFQGIIYGSIGDIYRRNGYWGKSYNIYTKMLAFVQQPIFYIQSAHVFGALADLDLRQGHLQSAYQYWQRALAVIQDRDSWGNLPLPVIGWVYIRLGEILYEWNELQAAWKHVQEGLEYAEVGGDVRAMIAGYVLAGRLKLTEGDMIEASHYLQQARPLTEQSQFSHWTSRFEYVQLEIWLAEDKLRTAVNWSDRILHESSFEERPDREITQLAIARVLLIKGDFPSLERALQMLAKLHHNAEKEGRSGIQLEALTLQSLIQWKQGHTPTALSSLEQALRLAEPENYIRLFADFGRAMVELLKEAHTRNVMPAYIEKLLGVMDDMDSPSELPEPLTARETQVLELIAAGLSNQEIADELVIAKGTAKKHVANILGKLNADNRTEAVAKARDFHLIH